MQIAVQMRLGCGQPMGGWSMENRGLSVEDGKNPSRWQGDRPWAEVADSPPNYRLSKFQPLMPDCVQREVVSTYLLDIEGARGWLEMQEEQGRVRNAK